MSDLARAQTLVRGAERIVVLTGAGVSAESGVPTFRGAGGLWKNSRAEELATPQAFARDPRLVWEWYGWRREVVAGCRPNAAHHAAFEAAGSADVCLVVGTSALVHPAAALPMATHAAGGAIIEVNPDSTPLTLHAAVTLRGPAAEIVPLLVD